MPPPHPANDDTAAERRVLVLVEAPPPASTGAVFLTGLLTGLLLGGASIWLYLH